MGNSPGLFSKSGDPYEYDSEKFSAFHYFRAKQLIPIEIFIAHFTPSSFPVLPVISPKFSSLCKKSWSKIIEDELNENGEVAQSGMTSFYNEFYSRLNEQDKSGEFDAVLSRNITGLNKIAAKGSIIIRIIRFVIAIETDSKETRQLITKLGISHSRKKIQPWQYSIFVETLLLTISSKLKDGATNDVMEAWVNLFAFIMKYMLINAIKDRSVKAAVALKTNVWTTPSESQEIVKEKTKLIDEPTLPDTNSYTERRKSPLRSCRGSVTSMASENLLSDEISPSVTSKDKKKEKKEMKEKKVKKEKKGYLEGALGRNRTKSNTGVCPVEDNSISISKEDDMSNQVKNKKLKDGLKVFSKMKTTTAATSYASTTNGEASESPSMEVTLFTAMDNSSCKEQHTHNEPISSSNFTKTNRDSINTAALSTYSLDSSKRNTIGGGAGGGGGGIDIALGSPDSSFFSRPMSPSTTLHHYQLQPSRDQVQDLEPDEIY